MKLVLVLAVATVMITSVQAQNKPAEPPAPAPAVKADKPPVVADADKAQLAIYERDLAELQGQIKDLQSQYQAKASQAIALINDINKKAGDQWTLNPQDMVFTKKAATDEPKK